MLRAGAALCSCCNSKHMHTRGQTCRCASTHPNNQVFRRRHIAMVRQHMGSAHTLGGHKIALAFSPTVALWTAAAVSAAPSRRRPPCVRRRPERHRILPNLWAGTLLQLYWTARHKGPGKTSDKASATSLAPAVRAKSASGRGLRAHARSAGRVRGKRNKGHLFGTESGPRRPVSWVRSAGRIRPEEQGPPRGGSGAARALPGAPRAAASTLRLSLFHRVLPSSSPASREFTI